MKQILFFNWAMNLEDHSSTQSLSQYIGLSAQDDLGPFWQNRIIFEKMPLDSDEIQQILREENHPLFD